MLAASPAVPIAQEARPAEPRVLADGNDAKYGRVENTHKVRFIEIFPTVLLLDDAEGTTWIMKGFQQGLEPRYTYDQFVAAGQGPFKKLPPGWKFRVKKLDKDLIETPEGGVATIMPDEFFNVYDRTGPGMTNWQPAGKDPWGLEIPRGPAIVESRGDRI